MAVTSCVSGTSRGGMASSDAVASASIRPERQRKQDDRRVAVGLRERERVDHAEQVGDEQRAPRAEAVDGHAEQRAEQRARDRQHDEEQREVARADVEAERREAPDRDDRDPVAGFADRLPEEEQREAPDPQHAHHRTVTCASPEATRRR